ncbi:hypothetical protein Nepgr_033510 [Nepenthes gracilis]|uniref:Uncharacterized protein n=1 Tax=Nepenthes gracilis TaxID=150966 RepID=A0AAD3Y904_NEPGR|nr:hypothetical protein Nepgr_033510 [Nepenthes gracilis]
MEALSPVAWGAWLAGGSWEGLLELPYGAALVFADVQLDEIGLHSFTAVFCLLQVTVLPVCIDQYGTGSHAADQTAVPQIAAEAWSCWWEATTGCSDMAFNDILPGWLFTWFATLYSFCRPGNWDWLLHCWIGCRLPDWVKFGLATLPGLWWRCALARPPLAAV